MQISTLTKPNEIPSTPREEVRLRAQHGQTEQREKRPGSQRRQAPDNNDSTAWSVATFWSIAALFYMLTILCWGLNKGFDPNLEGFYMLSYQHPELYPTFSSFHILLSKLPRLSSSLILHYRVLEVFADILPAALLSASFFTWAKKWLRLDQGQTIFAIVFASIGGVMAFTSCPRIISYNGLSAGLVFLAGAGAFVGLSDATSARAKAVRTALLFASGAFAGLAFFVKCTSACALLPALLAFVFFTRKRSTKANEKGASYQWIWQCATILAGAAASCLGYFTCVQAPLDWWHAFSDALGIEAQTSHKMAAVVDQFGGELALYWKKGCALVAACLVVNCLVVRGGITARATLWAVAAVICTALFLMTKEHYFLGKEAYVPLMAVALSGAMVPWRPFKSELFKGAFLLLLLPLIATIGTNCQILGFITSNLSPFFVLISVALVVASRTSRAPYAVATATIAFAVFCAIEFSQGYVTYRYDCDPLNEQTTQVNEIEPLRGIDLSPSQAQFFRDAKKILQANDFVAGDTLVGLYDLPGLNYALEAASPGQAFYVGWAERDILNAFYLKNSNLRAGSRLFVALNGSDPEDQIMQPLVKNAFKDQGVPFPESFKLIGRLSGPIPGNTVYLYKKQDLPANTPDSTPQ